MSNAVIISAYSERPHYVHKVDHSLPDLVERAGFIPLSKRIKAMDAAGERLIELRAEQFDLPVNASDEGVEPSIVSDLGSDPSEVYQAEYEAKRRLAAARREYDAALKAASEQPPENKHKEVDKNDGRSEEGSSDGN